MSKVTRTNLEANYSAGLKGGGMRGTSHALYDIASIYTVMHTCMITDYPHNNSAERKGGRGGTDRAVSEARACK